MHYRIRTALQSAALFATAVSLFAALAVRAAIAPDQTPQSTAKKADSATRAAVIGSYGKLPLSFEANRGLFAENVKFLARGAGYSLFLTPTEAALSLKPKSKAAGENGETIRMKLVGANPSPIIKGLDQLPGKSNYFIGNDPAKWRTDIPHFAKVKIESVYPGIDLVYYGNQRQLEYDWIVAPGADANAIIFSIKADDKPTIDSQGNLMLDKNGGLLMHKPFVYQDRNGVRTRIAAGYEIKRQDQIGFHVDGYDPSFPLVIDPILTYSTYLGGGAHEYAYSIAVDFFGAAYVTGGTLSTNFPRANPSQALSGAGNDAFITKLNASGNAIVYSTYLGGSYNDFANSIAVDSSGAAYVTGVTESTNFPTASPFQVSKIGITDAFAAKLDSSGAALVYSTYLGGGSDDSGMGIAVDSTGAAYVTGSTMSANFPTASPFQASRNGTSDAFVTKLNASGATLAYSTYLGGGSYDSGMGIVVDSTGAAYVAGYTMSTNFPRANPFQYLNGGHNDAFVAKLNPSGAALAYSTYLGGGDDDAGTGIAVDASGAAYVTGYTYSANFPMLNPLQALNGSEDAFVTKLDVSGATLVYSTYLGGGGNDTGIGIAVDSSGAAYVTGWTESTNFPTANPFQASKGGGVCDAFVTKYNASGAALVYSSYLGGGGLDEGMGIAVDSSGAAYMTGNTQSSNFPTASPFQALNSGGQDTFVVKIGEAQPVLEIDMTKSNYILNDTVTASVFRLKNLGPAALGELKVWLSIPGIPSVGIFNLGADGSFVIPASFLQDFGPIPLFTVSADLPRGIYEFSSRMTNPVSSKILSEDLNPFFIK